LPRAFLVPKSSQDVSDPPLRPGVPPQTCPGGSLTSRLQVTFGSRIVAESARDRGGDQPNAAPDLKAILSS
jgi:hypothetical protein